MRRLSRSRVLQKLALIALAGGISACNGHTHHKRVGPPGSDHRPNIVMLMTDDEAVGDMIAMPLTNDLIGGQGVTFANSFASWPLCCPSRATAFTGQYAHNHNVLGNYPPAGSAASFRTDDDSLAVWLQRSGYATAHIGKYLNGYGADRRGPRYVPPGWDKWLGLVDPTTYRMWGYTINDDGHDKTYGDPRKEDPALYQTDVLNHLALDEIDELAQQGDPFFLSVAYLAPHEELGELAPPGSAYPGPRPAPRHKGSLKDLALPRPRNFDEADVSDKPPVIIDFAHVFGNETMEQRTSRYQRRLEALRAVDESVRDIIQRLAARKLLDNTYIVFTSDNGWFNGEHGINLNKFLMYEPSIRVPLMMRGPDIPAHQTSQELVANIDLAPTFMEIAGAHSGRVVDGRSLVPFAQDATRHTRRPILLDAPHEQLIFATLHRKGGELILPAMRGLRTSHYSYVEYATGDVELYDLQRDPDQMDSLHKDPQYQSLRDQLHAALAAYSACSGDACRRDIDATLY